MQAKVLKKRGEYRVCSQDGKILKTRLGNAVDGGGHGTDKHKAIRQVTHINEAEKK